MQRLSSGTKCQKSDGDSPRKQPSFDQHRREQDWVKNISKSLEMLKNACKRHQRIGTVFLKSCERFRRGQIKHRLDPKSEKGNLGSLPKSTEKHLETSDRRGFEHIQD